MADIILGVPSLVDLCIRCGKTVMAVYQNLKRAKDDLVDLVQRLDIHWLNLEIQIQFFLRFQKFVDDRIQINFKNIVKSLHSKLEKMAVKVDKIYKERDTAVGKFKFALLAKDSLETAISDFVQSHSTLQPILFVLSRSTDPGVDKFIFAETPNSNKSFEILKNLKQALRTEAAGEGKGKLLTYVSEDPRSFKSDRQLIHYTSVEMKRLSGNTRVLIDTISCEGDCPIDIFHDFHSLARVLKEVDPTTFGIPACAGVVKVKNAQGKAVKLEMVFNVPQELKNPRSLRNLLLSADIEKKQYSINMRIELAKRLARTVWFVHTTNFAHKNFRPETIIVFDFNNETKLHEIGFPMLIGFEKVRMVGGRTRLTGDTAWEKNIYRHPSRQGSLILEQAYTMEHDIYSLGVCLLEIALWDSFVKWDPSGHPIQTARSKYLLANNRSPFDVKDKLIRMARELIPNKLGARYTDVTISMSKMLR